MSVKPPPPAENTIESNNRPASHTVRDALVSMLRVMAPVLAIGCALWIGNAMFSGAHARATQRVFVPAAMLALLCAVAVRHELKWAQPARRLKSLIEEIRAS